MSDTMMNPEDAAVHAEANKGKTDLSKVADTPVPSTEAVAPGTQRDPFADRKSIFLKRNKMNEVESQRVQNENPSVKEYVQAAEAASRGETPAPAGEPAQHLQTQAQPEYIQLQYNGRQLSVARRDIEAAGGQDGYLRQLQFDDMDASMAEQAAEMQRRRAELEALDADLKRRQEEFQRSLTVARETPATSGDGTSPQGRNGPAASADSDLEAESNRIVEQLFSGDPADAAKAVKQILAESRRANAVPTAEQVAELAAQRLKAMQPEPVQPRVEANGAKPVNPRWEAERVRINAMASTEFPQIANSPELAAVARAEIERLCSIPANKDRRAVDVAREACQNVQTELDRTRRVEMKQTLPTTTSAGGAAPAAGDSEKVVTNSDYVAMLADRRNFGVRR